MGLTIGKLTDSDEIAKQAWSEPTEIHNTMKCQIECLRRQAAIMVASLLLLFALTQVAAAAPAPRHNAASAAAGSSEQDKLLSIFRLSGDMNIMDEHQVGIFNGHVTTDTTYRDVMSLSGLFAPPYASSDFRLEVRLFGETIPTRNYMWYPFQVLRSGAVQGVEVSTTTVLPPGKRAVVLEVTLENTTAIEKQVPVQFNFLGSVGYVKAWDFGVPDTRTANTKTTAERRRVVRHSSAAAVVLATDLPDPKWEPWSSHWETHVVLAPKQRKTHYTVVTIGPQQEAVQQSDQLLADPGKAVAEARTDYAAQTKDLFNKIPRLDASDKRLVAFYNRCILPFLFNKWNVSEFVLHPYYSTGGINGGCVANYLWDFAGSCELLPLYDPQATKDHLKQFLREDFTKHFLFNPIDGKASGPTYYVNQEKIVFVAYYYVLHTGDVAFLQEMVNGKSVLDWIIYHASYGDDFSKPAVLVDYGDGNHHLELRGKHRYDNYLPDLNGRRYLSYMMAHRLSEIAGKKQDYLAERAKALKPFLKEQLWDPESRWFFVKFADGHKELRYTIQMYKMIGSAVLDREEESGLLGHLNETEFLSPYGIHSMSKKDPAYDQVDIDCGGGGNYVAFSPRIAELLYQAGHISYAEDILKRSLWWGERLPYLPDSLVANQIEYRRDTPLQNAFDASCGTQCIIFGMFGVKVDFNGDITVDPKPPKWSPRISLSGVKIRGTTFDVSVDATQYTVRTGQKTLRSKLGVPLLLKRANSRARE